MEGGGAGGVTDTMSSSSSGTHVDARPGANASYPHQDLRIPRRAPPHYVSQVLPSASPYLRNLQQAPSIATQIASLHRAAEVARFEWRAQQSRNVDAHNRYERRHYHRLPMSAREGATDERSRPSDLSRPSSRVYSSTLQAYLSAARDLSRPASGSAERDASDGDSSTESFQLDDDTSSDSSDETEEEVIAATLEPSRQRRRASAELHREGRRIGSVPEMLFSTSESLPGLEGSPNREHRVNDGLAESQVWDRMVEDLAIGAGVGNHYRSWQENGSMAGGMYSRGISSGIAASMLALSASIPRADTSHGSRLSSGATSRLLPHPIWARRYPGAAGEWLRGELARRAQASSQERATPASHVRQRQTDPNATARQSTSTPFNDLFSSPRPRDPQNAQSNALSPWNVLQFPSLDPSNRDGSDVSVADTVPAATVQANSRSEISLAVPSSATAFASTPPPMELVGRSLTTDNIQPDIRRDSSSEQAQDSTSPHNSDQRHSSSSRNNEAARLVARMATLTRERNNTRGAIPSASNGERGPLASRSVRGGMDTIRRLRVLDGLERDQSDAPESSAVHFDDPPSPPRPWEVFPWYQPPENRLSRQMERLSLHENPQSGDFGTSFDPNGATLDWYQMARARMAAAATHNDDPNGEHEDQDPSASQHTEDVAIRRRVVSGTSASQRLRNRSTLVIAESADPTEESSAVSNAGNVADGWTVIDQRPSSPLRRTRDEGSEFVTTWFRRPAFSTSPSLLNDSDDASTTRQTTATNLRRSRRPQRLGNLLSDNFESISGESNSLQDVANEIRPSRPTPGASVPQRRPEYSSRMHQTSSMNRVREARTFEREDTPSPEPTRAPDMPRELHSPQHQHDLSEIGAQLEEEFRSRQSELRIREERLRIEVARRRMELDELRQRQGRIGRIVERNREPIPPREALQEPITADNHIPQLVPASLIQSNDEDSEITRHSQRVLEETTPLLGTGPASPSLVRRHALRDSTVGGRFIGRHNSRRSMIAATPSNDRPQLSRDEAIIQPSSTWYPRQPSHSLPLRRANSWSSPHYTQCDL